MRAQDNVADLSSMKDRFGFRSVRSGRQVEATEAVSAGLWACGGLRLASPEPSSEPEEPAPSTLLTSVNSSSSSSPSSSAGAALKFNWPAQCEKKPMHLGCNQDGMPHKALAYSQHPTWVADYAGGLYICPLVKSVQQEQAMPTVVI